MKSWNLKEKVYKGDILLSSLVSVSITSVPRMLRKVIHLGFFPQNLVLESVMGFQVQNLGWERLDLGETEMGLRRSESGFCLLLQKVRAQRVS